MYELRAVPAVSGGRSKTRITRRPKAGPSYSTGRGEEAEARAWFHDQPKPKPRSSRRRHSGS